MVVSGAGAAAIACLALVLDAITSIASGGGPTKHRPAAPQARANPAFSARKPKPGCTAWAPARSAERMIVSPIR